MQFRLAVCFILIYFTNAALWAQNAVPGVGTGPGNALRFKNGNYVQLPLMTSLNSAEKLTVEGWVKPDSSMQGVLFAHWINYEAAVGTPVGLFVKLEGGNVRVATIAGNDAYTKNAPIKRDRWVHIACVFDGSLSGNANRLKVYVNGIRKELDFTFQTTPVPAVLGNISQLTYLGARRNNANVVFEELYGILDEMRVWKTARTQPQIRDKMCSRLGGTEPGLTGYWRMDEGTGNAVLDKQTNVTPSHGTLRLAPQWVLSGAAIGDTSTWGFGTNTLTLAVNGESFTANDFSRFLTQGSFIYHVSGVPTRTDGLTGLGSNNRYFGVFLAEGEDNHYKYAYNYTGNPHIATPSGCSMRSRWSNDSLPWKGVSALVAPPLIAGNERAYTRGEYILTNGGPTSSSQSIEACNAYNWQGNTYTRSGIYHDTIPNVAGCDSVLTLNLTVLQSPRSVQNTIICNAYTWNGTTYTISGTYYDTIPTGGFCDSIAQLNLTVKTEILVAFPASFCPGTSYEGYTTPGTYIDSFLSITGCDSIRILHLSLRPVTNTVINQTICAGQSYAGYTASGTYSTVFTAYNGCDSTHTLNLTVVQPIRSSIDTTVCEGQGYAGYFLPGLYTDTFQIAGGCDSMRTLRLSVKPRATTTLFKTICAGSIYEGYSGSGTYNNTFPGSNGCDSVRTLHLTVIPAVITRVSQSICIGTLYEGYASSGIYADTFPAATGCDSVRILTLSVVSPPKSWLGRDTTICTGDTLRLQPGTFDSYLWQDGSTSPQLKVYGAGRYEVTVRNSCGVNSDEIVVLEADCSEVLFPDAFTPNRDGRNDVFGALHTSRVTQFSLQIANRWGQVVFSTRNRDANWDGTVGGVAQPVGAYLYLCSYQLNGKTMIKKGTFMLIR